MIHKILFSSVTKCQINWLFSVIGAFQMKSLASLHDIAPEFLRLKEVKWSMIGFCLHRFIDIRKVLLVNND